MTPKIALGLPPDQHARAARLYWQAFGDKLGRVLGPEPRALAYLQRVISPQHAIVALDHGRIVGLAGFRSPDGGFAEGSAADLRAIYGPLGGSWRYLALTALSREIDNGRFLVDGICVAEDFRNRGIGRALILALCAEAMRRGYGDVRLEVIDNNTRARALYDRMGFTVLRHDRLGMLRLVFNFTATTTMVRRLP